MGAAVERVRAAVERSGRPFDVCRFSRPVPSAVAAAQELGCPPGAIANSMVFVVSGQPVLVLASGAHRVDTRRLAEHLGVARRRVRRADPELVLAVTGQRVGGVAPVGHPAALPTVVDRSLGDHDVVWAGAGDDRSVFATTADDLVRLTGGTWCVW